MMDRILALLAVLALVAFLGVLAWRVPQPALVTVIAVTLAMVVYDFLRSSGPSNR